MTWQPISEADLWDRINEDWEKMSWPQRRLWESIKIPPERWLQHPWGDAGGGFWVVAILGRTVIWFNDVEDGFNRSSYTKHGVIEDYWCNQDELGWTVQYLLDRIQTGHESRGYCGPPEPIT